MPHTAAVSLHVASRAGSGSEPLEHSGATHFVEHMLFRQHAAAPGAYASAIERLGGHVNAATEPELTAVGAKVPAEAWRAALDVVADMVRAPVMDPEEIEKERAVILDELAMIEDLPEESARRAVLQDLWPDHGFGREIAGTTASVRALTRGVLAARARAMFTGRNTVAAVAGAVDPDAALDALQDAFQTAERGAREVYPAFHRNGRAPRGARVISRDAEQAYFCIGGFVPGRASPDRCAVELLGAVLGAGFGARLVVEVRERRGLAYDIGADVDHVGQDGVLLIYGASEPDAIQRSVGLVLELLADVARRGVSEDDLERARAFVIGALVRSVEDSAAVAAWHAREYVLESHQTTPNALLHRLRAASRAEVSAAARAHLHPEWPVAAVAGPLDAALQLPHRLALDGAH